MPYVGKQPQIGNYIKLDAITTSATTTFNLTAGGVAVYPQTATNCIVSLNGIIQAPTDAYTISGSTIVFASALTASDVIDFITVLGDVLNIGTPSDGTVGIAKLSATGTPSSTTFLRGDNTWSAAVSAGAVLQVVTATDSTQRSTTSTSYVLASSTLTLSITPSSASNKIFIIVSTCIQPASTNNDIYYTIYRDTTNIGATNGMINVYSSDTRQGTTMSYLDSPATTSATTYEIRFKVSGGTGYINANSTKGSITAFEIKG